MHTVPAAIMFMHSDHRDATATSEVGLLTKMSASVASDLGDSKEELVRERLPCILAALLHATCSAL